MNRLNPCDPFSEAASYLGDDLQKKLLAMPEKWKEQINELRLRSDRPLMLNGQGQNYFLSESCLPLYHAEKGCVTVSAEELQEVFRRLCEYSVYSYQNQIRSGYITLHGGHRAGLCGTAVWSDGKVSGLRDISSVNLRIARTVEGAADDLFRRCPEVVRGGVLIVGPPGSGKTTLLRDYARQLADGSRSEPQRVTVVDERGELAMMWHGKTQAGKGFFCDVMDGCPKAEGILSAVRALNPQRIVCDEIGSQTEAEAVLAVLNTGVRFAASVHAGSRAELLQRPSVRRLLQSGAFPTVVFLAEGAPGRMIETDRAGEWNVADGGAAAAFCDSGGDRPSGLPAAV